MQNNPDDITDTERDMMRYIPCLSKDGTVYLLNPVTLRPARPFLDSLRWQVFGERETPACTHYTSREESALQTLGNILRTTPCLSVAECERLYGDAQRDLRNAGTILMQIIERDQRVLHIRRMVEAGAYEVEGERVAERILTHAQRRDFERRMDYLEKREEDFRQASGMEHDVDACEDEYRAEDVKVFRDPLFYGLLAVLIMVSVAVVFGAICDAWRFL